MNTIFQNEKLLELSIMTIEVLKYLKVIEEIPGSKYYKRLKEIKNKNEFNRIATKKYKDMYGIEPSNHKAFCKLITFILDEECIN